MAFPRCRIAVIPILAALGLGAFLLPPSHGGETAGEVPASLTAPQWQGVNEFRGGINLRWFRVQGAVRYAIQRRVGEDGEFKQVGFADNPAFDDLMVAPGNTYFYRIVPFDASGKAGTPSKDRFISLAREDGLGVILPPEWSAHRLTPDGVALSWSHVSSGSILAYNLYRKEKKEEVLQLLTSSLDTTFLDRTAKEGKSYSYVVTALGRNLQESDYSQILEITFTRAVRGGVERSPFASVRFLDEVIVRTERVAAYGWKDYGFVSPVDVDYLPAKKFLYVADDATGLITVIDSRGEVVGRMGGRGKAPWEFERLLGITLDRQGTLYAVDAYKGEVLAFDQQMQLVRRVALLEKVERYFGRDFHERYPAFRFGLVDLCLGPSGSLFLSDNPSGWIYQLDVQENLVNVIGRMGEEPGSLHYPTFLLVDGHDRLIVSDSLNSRVQILDAAGNPLAAIGEKGLGIGQFIRPKGVAIDGRGNIYVADSYLNAVQAFTPDGDYIGLLADKDGLPLDFGLPNGIAFIDPDLLVIPGKISRAVQVVRVPVLQLRSTVTLKRSKASASPSTVPGGAGSRGTGGQPSAPSKPAGAEVR